MNFVTDIWRNKCNCICHIISEIEVCRSLEHGMTGMWKQETRINI